MNHLNFLNDDEKRRRREEEVEDSLRKINRNTERTKPTNYYESSIEEDNYQRKKPEIAIDKSDITSFSPKSDNDGIYKTLSLILGVCLILTVTMLIFGSTFGFFKNPTQNITCSPDFYEGNTSLKCGDSNSTLFCPQINISLLCGSSYNITNYTYFYNYSNHS